MYSVLRVADAGIEIIAAEVVLDLQQESVHPFFECQRNRILVGLGDTDLQDTMDLFAIQEDFDAVIASKQKRKGLVF